MKRKLGAGILFILLFAFTLAAWHAYREQQQSARVLTGTVEVTKADVTAKASGYIKRLCIREGDAVHKGDKAAELERKDLEAALLRDVSARAKAGTKLQELQNGARLQELTQAAAETAATKTAADKTERDFTRAAALYADGAVARSFYDDAAAARDTASAQLKKAQAQEALLCAGTREEELQSAREELGQSQAVVDMSEAAVADLNVQSPLDGVVLTKNYEEGEYVTAGMPIATIADLSDCWVRVYLSPAELAKIKVGSTAKVMVDGMSERSFTGCIREISDKAEYTPRQSITKNERANLVFGVKVGIDNSEGIMKPGMPADVIFDE